MAGDVGVFGAGGDAGAFLVGPGRRVDGAVAGELGGFGEAVALEEVADQEGSGLEECGAAVGEVLKECVGLSGGGAVGRGALCCSAVGCPGARGSWVRWMACQAGVLAIAKAMVVGVGRPDTVGQSHPGPPAGAAFHQGTCAGGVDVDQPGQQP